MQNNNSIKAPIKVLRSSWVSLAYTKAKSGPIIKKSLGNPRQSFIAKNRGDMFTNSSMNHSNLY